MNDLVEWLLLNYGQEQVLPGTGLERTREAVIDLIPSLQKSRIITICGTNGKGETTLRLSSLLKNHTHTVWTSPHILRLTERFRNERGEISEEELKILIGGCHEKVKTRGLKLSFYEFLFFVFCTWTVKEAPEFILLEVGLGGRLDSVNVLDAELVLLPSISRDHQEFLGNRYELILKEKLGVLRKDSMLIHFLELRYLEEKAQSFVSAIGAKVRSLESECHIPAFDFSRRNEVLASAAYAFLLNTSLDLPRGKAPMSLEHRGEVVSAKNEYIFFGSHNVDGLRKLIQFLQSANYNFSRPPYDLVIVAFSRRNTGDLKVMMRMLKKGNLGKVVVTSFNHPKALARDLAEVLSSEEGLEFVQDIESYLEERDYHQRCLVTGSYYFLGSFKSILRG